MNGLRLQIIHTLLADKIPANHGAGTTAIYKK